MDRKSLFLLMGGSALVFFFLKGKSEAIPARWMDPPYGWERGLLPPVRTQTQANILNYRYWIMREAERIGIEAAILAAIIDVESAGDPNAMRDEGFNNPDGSRAFAYGLMQLLWTTALMMDYPGSKKGLLDPETNIIYGAKYLAHQKTRYSDPLDIISAYNCGTVDNPWWRGYSNQGYVDKVVLRIKTYRRHFMWYYPGYVLIFPA